MAECWFYTSHSLTTFFWQISSCFMFTQVRPNIKHPKCNCCPMWSKQKVCTQLPEHKGVRAHTLASYLATVSHNPTTLCSELLMSCFWSINFICTSGIPRSRWVGHFNDFVAPQIISQSKILCVKCNPFKEYFSYVSTHRALLLADVVERSFLLMTYYTQRSKV